MSEEEKRDKLYCLADEVFEDYSIKKLLLTPTLYEPEQEYLVSVEGYTSEVVGPAYVQVSSNFWQALEHLQLAVVTMRSLDPSNRDAKEGFVRVFG